MRPGTLSTRFGSPLKRSAKRASTTTSSPSRARELVGLDRVVRAHPRLEGGGLDPLLTGGERAKPGVEVDHGALVVPEVAQEPPEPLGAAHQPVGDDEHAFADTRAGRLRGELLGIRQRVPAAHARRRREVLVHVEERGARDVALEVELAPPPRAPELPPAIDELVAHPAIVTRRPRSWAGAVSSTLDQPEYGLIGSSNPIQRPMLPTAASTSSPRTATTT